MNYITIAPGMEAIAAKLLTTNFVGTSLAGTPETESDYGSGIVVAADGKTFAMHDLVESNERVSNGSSTVDVYQLDNCTVFVENGDNDGLHIYPANTLVKEFIAEWEHNESSHAEFMAEWGYTDGMEEATAGDKNVAIWCVPNYYAGTLGAPIAHFVRDEVSGDVLVFDTTDDAQAWIDEVESEVYVLAHGEAGRPEYVIARANYQDIMTQAVIDPAAAYRNVLDGYPASSPVSELYDVDAQFREALNGLIPDFEYPDYSHRTVGEIKRMWEGKKVGTFIESADSRGTSSELMEAILYVAGGNEAEAGRIWERPTEAEQIAIWERVTKNGLIADTEFYWGESGNDWATDIRENTKYQGWTNSATFLAAQYIQQEPTLNDVITKALNAGVRADGPGFETLVTQVCDAKMVVRNATEEQDEERGCGLIGKVLRLDSWAKGNVNWGEIGENWANELAGGKTKDTRIFVVEVPHQRPASAWVAADREDFIDRVNRTGPPNGPLNDFDASTAYVKEDLHRLYIFEGGETAAKGLSEITGHQSGHAFTALREKLISYGVFEEVQDKVLETSAALGIAVDADKVQQAIREREGPKTAVMIGKVLAVNDDLGLVFQSIGQGKGVVLPAETLSRPVVVGNVEVISYVDGKGTVSDRTVKQERGRE